MKLRIKPLELREANSFIEEKHRHHKRVQGHRFSIGCYDGDELIGCAVAGRPTSGLDPKRVLEVTRCCTDGTRNVCSMLYTAVARAGQAIGYERIQTYIFKTEDGASLKASGWRYERDAHPSGRHHVRSDGETRNTDYVEVAKTLWVRDFSVVDKLAHHKRRDTPNHRAEVWSGQ